MALDNGSLLSQFADNSHAAKAPAPFARDASPGRLSEGRPALNRSEQATAFAQEVGQLFGSASPIQQAPMLNDLLADMGPTALVSLLTGPRSDALGALAWPLMQRGAAPPDITPEQASKLSPEQVQVIANHAALHRPAIVDTMGEHFARHANLINPLGSIALAEASETQQRQGKKRPGGLPV